LADAHLGASSGPRQPAVLVDGERCARGDAYIDAQACDAARRRDGQFKLAFALILG
jgi:hypothetical protein